MHTHTITVWSNEQQQYTINLWRLYWHWLKYLDSRISFLGIHRNCGRSKGHQLGQKHGGGNETFRNASFFSRDGVCVYFEAHHTSQSATQLQQKTILNEVCHRWTNAKTTSKANPSGMVALNPLDIFRYTNVQLIIELEQICLQVISYIKRFLKQKVAKVY